MKNQLLILFAFITFSVNGQNLADTIPICKNAISLEFLGSSCSVLSIQYDRIIKKNQKSFFSLNAGFGYMPYMSSIKQNQIIGTSLALDWNNKLYKKNHILGGIGIAYSDGFFQHGFANEMKKSYKVLYASLRVGYKFQKTTKGVFLKIMATPIFKIYEFSDLPYSATSILPLIGVGIGYSF